MKFPSKNECKPNKQKLLADQTPYRPSSNRDPDTKAPDQNILIVFSFRFSNLLNRFYRKHKPYIIADMKWNGNTSYGNIIRNSVSRPEDTTKWMGEGEAVGASQKTIIISWWQIQYPVTILVNNILHSFVKRRHGNIIISSACLRTASSNMAKIITMMKQVLLMLLFSNFCTNSSHGMCLPYNRLALVLIRIRYYNNFVSFVMMMWWSWWFGVISLPVKRECSRLNVWKSSRESSSYWCIMDFLSSIKVFCEWLNVINIAGGWGWSDANPNNNKTPLAI